MIWEKPRHNVSYHKPGDPERKLWFMYTEARVLEEHRASCVVLIRTRMGLQKTLAPKDQLKPLDHKCSAPVKSLERWGSDAYNFDKV